MEFDAYYNLTPAARSAARGSVATRPFHADWPNEQMTVICDFVAHNPWVRQTLGGNLNCSVQLSKAGDTLLLIVSKQP